jgi:hypothetical protein
MKMHMNTTEYYKGNYKKLPKLENERIVIVFALDEIKDLKPFVNSLLDQNIRVNDIGVNIPYRLINRIPESVKSVVSLYGQSTQYNGSDNLIPTVLREPESNTKIILVEPYYVYNQDFISDMVDMSNENPNDIIYSDQAVLVKPCFFDSHMNEFRGHYLDCIKRYCKNSMKKCDNDRNYKCM